MQIIRFPDVILLTGLSRSSILAFVKKGTFPAKISLGSRAVGWNKKSVIDWLNARPEK